MKKALNAWTASSAADFEAMFAALSLAGFDAVELNIDNPSKSAHSLSLDTDMADYAAIRELCKKYSLSVPSISTSLWAGNMGNTEKWTDAERLLHKQIEAAKALGGDGILIVPGGMDEEISLDRARKNCIEFLMSQRDFIEKEGIFVGVENVWNGFFMSPYDMASFIDEIGCPKLGAYFDVGNVIAFANPTDFIEVLGSRIGKIHVKDFKLTSRTLLGGTWEDVTHGSADWKKIIPALRKAGYDGYIVAEVSKADPDMSYDAYYKKVAAELGEIIKY